MIPPLIFSLLAFFVVITTTVVVIKNKSKVSNINKKIKTTTQTIEIDKHTNEKKLQNLVHDINFNNKKLENSHNNTKAELKLENRKTNEKVNNLDKRFNSYKNITTANFMGINNRMTSENERLQQEIDINKELINQNRRDHRAGINSNAAEIFNTNDRMSRFINDDYYPTINNINNSHLSAVNDIANLRSNLANSVISSSNMNLDARILIRDDVRGRYDRTNNSLTNFFNLDTNFIENNYTYSSNNNLFRDWYDNYYNVSSYSNFKKFDDLLLAADQDMNELRLERQRIDTLEGRATNIENVLHPDSNLYKNDLASYISSEYNFDLENLKNIQDNTREINSLSEEVSTLSNLLKEISLVDATGSVITLDALNSNIQENSRKIRLNENAIDERFNKNFGTYMGSNLVNYYQTITDNLTESVLNNKIANKNHTFNIVNVKDITASNVISKNSLETEKDVIFGGDLISGSTSYKDKIDNNENYTKTLDHVFSYDNTFKQHNNVNDEITLDPMIKFIKPIIPGTISSETNLDKTVDMQAGINLSLKRDKTRDGRNIGGKLFIDDWNDIGLNKYVQGYNGMEIKNDLSINQSIAKETLGSKFIDIDDRLASMSNDISSFTIQQQNGMMKYQLYNLLNDYNTDTGLSSSYENGKFEDQYANSMRVKHLYTGEPPGNYKCTNDDNSIKVDAPNQCITIDNRLKALESVQTAAFGESLEQNLRDTYNISLDNRNALNPLNIDKEVNAKHNINITNSLSVGGNTSLNGDIKVNGNLYVGDSFGKLIMEDVNDLKVKSGTDGSTTDFQKYFVKKNDVLDSDDYVKNIASTPTGFEYTLSSGVTTPISFPTSSAPTVESSDIKRINEISGAINNGNQGDIKIYEYKTYAEDATSGLVSKTIEVPQQYVYNINDNANGTLTVKQKNYNSDSLTSFDITKGISSRAEIINKLTEPVTNTEEAVPVFNNGIKFGSEGCIRMSGGKILACDSGCDNCSPVWDYAAAPAP